MTFPPVSTTTRLPPDPLDVTWGKIFGNNSQYSESLQQDQCNPKHILGQLAVPTWHTLGALTSLAERILVPRRVIALVLRRLSTRAKKTGFYGNRFRLGFPMTLFQLSIKTTFLCLVERVAPHGNHFHAIRFPIMFCS